MIGPHFPKLHVLARRLYMLCNSLFASVIATSSVEVLGDPEERELLLHEATAGIKQSAEASGRLIIDFFVVMLMAPAYAFPLKAFSNIPIAIDHLVSLYLLTAWAMSAVGYIFSLVSPSNSTLLTAATTQILFAFLSGGLLGPSALPHSLRHLFWVNPGFGAFIQMMMGNAIKMPFSLDRWALTTMLLNAEILPSNVTEAKKWDTHEWVWLRPSILSMVVFGAALRCAATIRFTFRTSRMLRVTWLGHCSHLVLLRILRCLPWRSGRAATSFAHLKKEPESSISDLFITSGRQDVIAASAESSLMSADEHSSVRVANIAATSSRRATPNYENRSTRTSRTRWLATPRPDSQL